MVLDNALLKDTIVTQLLTNLQDLLLLFIHFHESSGFSGEALRFPEHKGQSTDNS